VTIAALFIAIYGAAGIVVAAGILAVIGARRKQRIARWWAEPAGVLIVLAAIYLNVPLYVRFFASLPFLERYVEDVAAGVAPAVPRQVGLFRVSEVEVLPNHVVRLITTTCMLDDCGLVFSKSGSPPVVGEDSYSPIASGWWTWWRSW
jgi:hypothetical protein